MVERIKNYLVYIFSNFSKSTHQMYAKKLHTLRLWQKNCTPSGFYGKKIAPFWAASLSEIAIWCATWTGMQNNCSIIKLYYRVLIINIDSSFCQHVYLMSIWWELKNGWFLALTSYYCTIFFLPKYFEYK